ncbi:hypothetical protein FACS1894200_03750 [Spirochaetia bacterium]|nr:hypothetical protein FACS1894200_03750 [Spirochaetia bacterium]
MKKLVCFLAVGLACLSTVVFAQTPDPFGSGFYETSDRLPTYNVGQLLGAVLGSRVGGIEGNQYVIVKGTLQEQRVPGTFVLVDKDDQNRLSVVVHIDKWAWFNNVVTANEEVLIFGIAHVSDLTIEIDAIRVYKPDQLPEK